MKSVITYLRIDAAAGWAYSPETNEPIPAYVDFEQQFADDVELTDELVDSVHQEHRKQIVTGFRVPPHFITQISEAAYREATEEVCGRG